MAWNCDVCGELIHFKELENGKKVPIPCPLEQYKIVKSYFSHEFQHVSYRFEDMPISNDPQDLKELSKIVPQKTILTDYLRKQNRTYQTKSLLISGNLRTFYLHYLRFLLTVYGDNTVHFVDSDVTPRPYQFNYLWLTPSVLKSCFFKEGGSQTRFKSMSELLNPSLVIYSLGDGQSMPMKNWGEIVLDLLTNRRNQGKSTWILFSKAFSDCQETTSSEDLRMYLSNHLPKIKLDEDEVDPTLFGTPQVVSTNKRGRKNKNDSNDANNYI